MDLHWLRDLARAEGPFATVYLDATHDTPQATQKIELAWRGLRGELEGTGADQKTLAALDEAVRGVAEARDRPTGRAGRLVVAAGGSVLLDEPLPTPPDPPRARWSVLPDLVPALTALPERLVTVVAVVDAAGADLSCGERVEHVDTGQFPLHKVRGGGTAHLGIQRRVDEKERASAAETAGAIDDLVASSGAALLVLGGETQARGRVRGSLGHRASEIVAEVEVSGRGGGADNELLNREVARLVAERVAAIRRAEAERYERVAGRGGRAAEGLAPVTEALRADQVDTLYLDAERAPTQRMWIGPDADQLATDPEDLASLGIPPAGPVAAVDALLRAAIGTGARFYPVGGGRAGLVGRELTDGVAAILRGDAG